MAIDPTIAANKDIPDYEIQHRLKCRGYIYILSPRIKPLSRG